MHFSELWESDLLRARLARAALAPLSGLYGLGWEGYLGVYKVGIKRARRPHSPVVCVGNLVAGGSGKSPLTLHLARVLREMGREVVVGCSGYGGPHAEAAAIAPDGQLSATEWGDEPAMFRWLVPDLPLVVGRRRVLAAELVHRRFPNAVLLMDDGFQHLPLAKDVTVLLDDPNPRNRLCLPAGPYREPRWNRRRADLVVPGRFKTTTSPLRFVAPDGTTAVPSPIYNLLCALGQPRRFVAEVEAATGAAATQTLLLGDHDSLREGNLLDRFGRETSLVVTAKDWVKLRERADMAEYRIAVALHDVRIEPADEFRGWLDERLNGRSA